MTAAVGRSPIVIDADVYGAGLVPGSALAARYEPLIAGRPGLISFQTAAAELRAACVRAGHALAQPHHDTDRWIAATTLRLGARWYPTTASSPASQGSRLRRLRREQSNSSCAGIA